MFAILGSSGYVGSKIFHFLTKKWKEGYWCLPIRNRLHQSQDFEGIPQVSKTKIVN